MNTEQERAEFEAWAASIGFCVTGKYAETIDVLCAKSAFKAGYQAGRAALHSQDREDAKEIAATLATALHFIPRSEEPELYDDIDALCVQFSNHARNIVGEKDAISMD